MKNSKNKKVLATLLTFAIIMTMMATIQKEVLAFSLGDIKDTISNARDSISEKAGGLAEDVTGYSSTDDFVNDMSETAGGLAEEILVNVILTKFKRQGR